MGFLYFLLFVLFLSILIVIHELGHLTAAKFFKVYCAEFSIGFGPALIHKRRKGGETFFSLRAIPFGGYVAMYGEGDTRPIGAEEIPEERSLSKQKKWKQAIIMVAGVTMNVLLAIVMFFLSEQACPQYSLTPNYATFKQDSIVLNAGIDPNKAIYMRGVSTSENASTSYALLSGQYPTEDIHTGAIYPKAYVIMDGQTTPIEVSICLNQSKFTIKDSSYDSSLIIFENYNRTMKTKTIVDGQEVTRDVVWKYPDLSKNISLENAISLKFQLCNCDYEVTPEGKLNALENANKVASNEIELMSSKGKIKSFGASALVTKYWNNYQPTKDKNGISDDRNALRKTFVDFGNSATVIFKGIGSLFTPNGWKNVGGLIAIGVTTSQTLENLGFARFLFYWGMISVNLAIVNIFPFPGLDGWHLLVIGVEGVTKKKIPEKVKTIVSLIGIGFLFLLMILIIIKDIMMFV